MKLKTILVKIASYSFWIVLWQILSMTVGLDALLPSPFQTLICFSELAQTGDFWISCGMSIFRISVGLLSGALFAVILAALTYTSRIAYELFSPMLTVIKATPVTSFILLALIWIGRESVPAFMTFLVVLPIIWSAVHHSITSVDPKLKEMVKIFNFSRSERLKHLYFPSVFPSFMSAFVTSVGIAWKAGVAAEVLATPKFSIGKSIFESKKYFETTELFAWTSAVIILSLIIEKILKKICLMAVERSEYDKN